MPSKSCRTGRIEWGRDPSALAFVDVMLKDGAAAFFLIQPSQFKRHTREFPSRFAPLQHETLALPIPEGVFAETASNRPPALIYDILGTSKIFSSCRGEIPLSFTALRISR